MCVCIVVMCTYVWLVYVCREKRDFWEAKLPLSRNTSVISLPLLPSCFEKQSQLWGKVIILGFFSAREECSPHSPPPFLSFRETPQTIFPLLWCFLLPPLSHSSLSLFYIISPPLPFPSLVSCGKEESVSRFFSPPSPPPLLSIIESSPLFVVSGKKEYSFTPFVFLVGKSTSISESC